MSVTLGPFPAYLQGRFPPLDSAAPNSYVPFAADLMERHTKHARRHRLGLWETPRCDPGSSTWFKQARAQGQCANKSGDAAAKDAQAKDSGDVDASISIPVLVYIVF